MNNLKTLSIDAIPGNSNAKSNSNNNSNKSEKKSNSKKRDIRHTNKRVKRGNSFSFSSEIFNGLFLLETLNLRQIKSEFSDGIFEPLKNLKTLNIEEVDVVSFNGMVNLETLNWIPYQQETNPGMYTYTCT